MARVEKKAIVRELAEGIEKSQSMILTGAKGVNVKEIMELRNQVRSVAGRYCVVKNSLARIAVEEKGLNDLLPYIQETTGLTFISGEAVPVAKVLVNFSKGKDNFIIKGGVYESQMLDSKDIFRLAALPGRKVLLNNLLYTMHSPLIGLINVLQGSLRELIGTLSAIIERGEPNALHGREGEK